jgi:uncharacterized membrane protein HdeD (DUF308 family)
VPPLSRWYIKAAMIYLVAGLLMGALQALQQPLHLPSFFAATGPASVHMLVVGWITQMIFGVAYWMFPKDTAETPRGNNPIAVATIVLLNAGLILRVVVEPMRAWRSDSLPGWWLAVAGLAQALAGIGFAINTWPRVKVK